MTDSSDPNHPDFDDLLAFAPVPLLPKRANGWSAERQRRFVLALSVMGSVGPAVRAVGILIAFAVICLFFYIAAR